MSEFEGRVAIVTGGSRGIGRAIVRELAARGASVAFSFTKNREMADHLVAELQSAGKRAMPFQADVTDFGAAEAMVKAVKGELGSVDYLVNNAGITRDKLIMMMTQEDWDAVIDTNLKGVFNVTRHAVSVMVRQRRGSILNIASISGVVGMAGQTNYSASKAGLIGLTRDLAQQWTGRKGIRVNALAPGYFESEMTEQFSGDYIERVVLPRTLEGRLGRAVELSAALIFLASDAGSYVTGMTLPVEGGMLTS